MRLPDRERSDLLFAVACFVGLLRGDLDKRPDRNVGDQLDLGGKPSEVRGRDRLLPKQIKAIMKDIDNFFRQI